jgi:hypothetical protein
VALSQNSLNNGAHWEVRWIGTKKKVIVHKVFDEDFGGALALYTKLKKAQRAGVTLRCMNVGFAPPDRITHHEVERWEVVQRRGKRYKRKVVDIVDMMRDYNARGIWWCPYCIQLRLFRDRSTPGQLLFECPVCEISNYNWHVKRWNPMAKTVEYRTTKRSGSARNRSKRVRRRS